MKGGAAMNTTSFGCTPGLHEHKKSRSNRYCRMKKSATSRNVLPAFDMTLINSAGTSPRCTMLVEKKVASPNSSLQIYSICWSPQLKVLKYFSGKMFCPPPDEFMSATRTDKKCLLSLPQCATPSFHIDGTVCFHLLLTLFFSILVSLRYVACFFLVSIQT